MKKKVNGRVVDIKNMGIFEKAFEGMALNRVATSAVSDKLSSTAKTINKSAINKVIVAYTKMYEALPFPLYGIEEPIKYCVIGNCIKSMIDNIECWVTGSLFVRMQDGIILRFVGSSWCTVDNSERQYDGLNMDIDDYEDSIGYEEFDWVMERLIEKKPTSSFYEVFMPDFVKACISQPIILKWELSRILEFGSIPDKLELKENRLIDTVGNKEYIIDIFSKGKQVSCGEETLELVINNGMASNFRHKQKLIRVYDFNAYVKEVKEDKNKGKVIQKLKIDNVDGISSLFERIVQEGIYNDSVEKVVYTGLVVGDNILYEIGNTIYSCKLHTYEKSVSIAQDISIYGLDGNRVYLEKLTKCESGIQKSVIYAFDTEKKNIRLCRIQYIDSK